MSASRGDVADYLGLTIEIVPRSLTVMKKQELIRLDHLHAFSLLKPAKLAKIAAAARS